MICGLGQEFIWLLSFFVLLMNLSQVQYYNFLQKVIDNQGRFDKIFT